MALSMKSLILKMRNLQREAPSLFLMPCTVNFKNQIQSIHIKTSPLIKDLDQSKLPEFEISKNPNEWKHVENLIPLKLIPIPKNLDTPAPSGWVPPREEAKNLPYFIPRTKNHMHGVHLNIKNRGLKHVTTIRRIHGDIWQLEKDLRQYLESKQTRYYKHIASHVNELNCQLRFRGDYVALVKEWMNMKGF